MYVACPSCRSLYQIQLEHLRAAAGKLRCGSCQTVFNATEAVFEEAQQALDYAQQHPLQEDVAREIDELVNKALGEAPPEQEVVEERAGDQAPAEPVIVEEQPGDQAPAEPEIAEEQPGDQTVFREDIGAPPSDELSAAEQLAEAEAGYDVSAVEELAGTQADDWLPESEEVSEEDAAPRWMPDEEVGTEGAPREELAFEAQEGAEEVAPPAGKFIEDIVIEAVGAPEVYRELRADRDLHAHPVAAEFTQRQAEPKEKPEEEPEEEPDVALAYLLEQPEPGAGSRIPWGAIAACFLLIALLLGQYAYFERYRLAKFPELRAAMELFCAQLQCDLPLRRDLSRVQMVEREVRDHPQVRGALLINASFVNRADFPQAYPVFQISFSDMSGTPVSMRRFRPDEYLGYAPDPSKNMAPGEQADLMLEVLDPGKDAVSFEFDFL